MKFNKFLQNKKQNINESQSFLNEAEENSFLSFFKSVKAYATLTSKWPSLYQEKKDAELEKVEGEAKLDVSIKEKLEDLEEKLADGVNDKLKNVPREKRKLARQQLEAKNKTSLDKAKDMLAAKKNSYGKQMDAKITAIRDEITELERENSIDNTMLSKEWQITKTETQLDLDAKTEEAKVEAKYAGREDIEAEAIERATAKAREKMRKEAAEKKEKIAELEQEADRLKSEFDEKLAAKEGEAKETITAMRDVQTDMRQYLAKGKEITTLMGESVNIHNYTKKISEYNITLDEEEAVVNEEGEDQEEAIKNAKNELKELGKSITAKLKKLSVSKIKKALDIEEEQAEDIYNNFTEQWKDIQKSYKADKDKVDATLGNDEEESNPAAKSEPKDEGEDKEAKKQRLNNQIDAKREEISRAQQDEKPQEEIDALVDQLRALRNELENLGESVSHIDEFLKGIKVISETSIPAQKTIMKFSDFLSQRNK